MAAIKNVLSAAALALVCGTATASGAQATDAQLRTMFCFSVTDVFAAFLRQQLPSLKGQARAYNENLLAADDQLRARYERFVRIIALEGQGELLSAPFGDLTMFSKMAALKAAGEEGKNIATACLNNSAAPSQCKPRIEPCWNPTWLPY
jgi:hypothetical protein